MALVGDFNKTINTLKKVTDASDKYATSLRLLNTVLGDSTGKATAFISKLTEMTGLDETTLTNQIAKFSQLGESLNLSDQYAEQFAEDLTLLSTKLAMLYNTDYSVMATRLQRAIQGTQTSTERLTGISATEAGRQAVLFENGINRQISSLNEAELAIVNYAAILRRVTNDTSVYQDAVNSLAWQKQILASQVRRLATAFGQLLTPALTKVFTALNAVLMVVIDIIKFLGRLAGITIDVSKSVGGAGGVSSGFDKVGKSIKGAADTAKRSLRSFDKLNNITTPTSASSGADSGMGIDPSILGLLGNTSSQMLDINNKARQIADTILSWLGFTRDENGELQWSGKLLAQNILKGIKNIFKWLFSIKGLVAIIIGFGIYKLLKKIKELKMGAATTIFAKALKALAVGIAGLLILGGIVLVLKEFVELIKAVAESGMSVTDVLALIGGLLGELTVAVGGLVLAFKLMSIKDIAAAVAVLGSLALVLKSLRKLVEALSKSGMTMSDVLIGVGGLLTELIIAMGLIVGLAKILSKDPLALVGVLAVVTAISAILIVLKETLPTILSALGNFITQIAPFVITLIKEIGTQISNVIKLLGTVLPPIINSVGNLFTSIFNGIANVIRAVGDVITRLFNGIDNVINSIGRTVERILTSIGDLIERLADTVLNFVWNIGPAVENSVNAILRAVTRLVNFVISAIEYLVNNTVAKGVNKIIEAIKKLPGTGNISYAKSISIPRFSGYKEGGFPKEEDGFFYANHKEMVGKFTNGKTAVANNDQIVEGIQAGVFSAMMSALRNTEFGGGDVVIEATGDTEGLLNFISFKQKQKDRQFN